MTVLNVETSPPNNPLVLRSHQDPPRVEYQKRLETMYPRHVVEGIMMSFDVLQTPESREWFTSREYPGWSQFNGPS